MSFKRIRISYDEYVPQPDYVRCWVSAVVTANIHPGHGNNQTIPFSVDVEFNSTDKSVDRSVDREYAALVAAELVQNKLPDAIITDIRILFFLKK